MTRYILFFSTLLTITVYSPPLTATPPSGITHYYIRLDHHFSSHRSIKAQVTMMPAENDFRAPQFSLILVDGIVRTAPQSAGTRVAAMVRKAVFTQVLESRGLKSVQTLDQDSVISYEGMIISPADIAISAYDPVKGGYQFTAGVQFSPLAFPDQWESLRSRYNIKQILNDFFLLFE